MTNTTLDSFQVHPLRDKRLIIAVVLLAAISLSFWGSSRYPNLDTKAMMGGDIVLDDALSFDAVWELPENPTMVDQVIATFANWIYVNWKGMTFGLTFAILFMAILPLILHYLPTRSGTSIVAGMIIGVPLGLCVNCAAPVAFGLHQRGSKAETALATMLSSPALNIVVLGMAISLLPWYYYATKIALTIILILAVMPVLLRFWPMPEVVASGDSAFKPDIGQGILTEQLPAMNWRDATVWLLKTVWQQGIWLLSRMVPLMLLAGLIGAVFVTLLPWDEILRHLPKHGYLKGFVAMGLLGLFALILPVPIAFDVVVVATLVAAGIAGKYGGVLLFALGSFSVYSWLVLRRANGRAIANAIALAVLGLSIVGGTATHFLGKWDHTHRQQRVFRLLAEENPREPVLGRDNSGEVITESGADPVDWKIDHRYPDSIESVDFLSAQNATGSMVPQDADATGIKQYNTNLMQQFILFTNGIASGDIDNDGWPDLVIAGTSGIQVFINRGGSFQHRGIPALEHSPFIVGAVALVDLDNNGWQDLVYTALRQGVFAAYNNQNRFEPPVKLPSRESVSILPLAIGFFDLNKDRYVDIVIGHYNYLGGDFISLSESRNELLTSSENGYVASDLPGVPGETLSVLITDLNSDNHPDLWVGNDYDEPDVVYMSNPGTGEWKQTTDAVAASTGSTMSIDVGDFDNNLLPDSYHVQISGNPLDGKPVVERKSFADFYEQQCPASPTEFCSILHAMAITRNAWTKSSPSICYQLEGEYRDQCILVIARNQHIQDIRNEKLDDSEICSMFLERFPHYLLHCHQDRRITTNDMNPRSLYFENAMPQTRGNLLFEWSGGQSVDQAETRGLNIAGWGWNAKFADLDGDNWQDVFVVNGFPFNRSLTSNAWFRNNGGENFEERTRAIGLTDFEATPSYTYFDYDLDGDLDIVTHAYSGKVQLYNNRVANNNNIQIELRDQVGNWFGIGSKIVLRYGNQEHQMREIKASGGFMSFDNPVAHFGMGEISEVHRIDVHWSTGEVSSYDGPFVTGKRYRIKRTN